MPKTIKLYHLPLNYAVGWTSQNGDFILVVAFPYQQDADNYVRTYSSGFETTRHKLHVREIVA